MTILKTASYLLAACLALVPLSAAGVEFEVASVRPSAPLTVELVRSGVRPQGITIEQGKVDITRLPIAAMLQIAYRVQLEQITGPDWIKSQQFDISAKMPAGATEEQVPEMLRALLVERFKLAVHQETKDQPAYGLVIAKGGLKAKEIAADTELPSLLPPADSSAPPPVSQIVPMGAGLARAVRTSDGGGVITIPNAPGIRLSQTSQGMHLEAPKITLAQLSTVLTEMVNRRVVDMTETKGSYQIMLDVSREELMAAAQAAAGVGGPPGQASMPKSASNPMADALVTAVQKVGLRLESRKAPTEMIVIDHLEKTPSEN